MIFLRSTKGWKNINKKTSCDVFFTTYPSPNLNIIPELNIPPIGIFCSELEKSTPACGGDESCGDCLDLFPL